MEAESAAIGAVGGGVVVSATPYPWPFHGRLDPARLALVVCLDPRWRAPGTVADACDERLIALGSSVRTAGGVVISVIDTPPRSGHSRPTLEASLVTGVRASIAADFELVAGATNAFYGSILDDVLRAGARRDLLLAGWGLEGPVHSTLRAANDRGYECLLVIDASAPLDEDLVFASSEMVRFSGGIFGAVAQSHDVQQLLMVTEGERDGS